MVLTRFKAFFRILKKNYIKANLQSGKKNYNRLNRFLWASFTYFEFNPQALGILNLGNLDNSNLLVSNLLHIYSLI